MKKPRLITLTTILLTLASDAAFAGAQANQPYSKVSTLDPVIHLVNGRGTASIYLLEAKGASIERVKAIDATGHVDNIPAADIQIGPTTSIDSDTVAIPVNIATQAYVEPGVPYEGTLLIFGKEGEPPFPIKFRIEDDTVVAFDIEPSAITATITDGQATKQRLRVRNTGKAAISFFQLTSSTLTDSTNQHRTQITPYTATKSVLPDHVDDLDLVLPEPAFAGSYAGTIIVSANGVKEKSVPITLQIRGPYNSCKAPFWLFVGVVLAGFLISSLLDSWFGLGGLQRARAYLKAKAAENQVSTTRAQIAAWKPTALALNPPCSVPRTEIWLSKTLIDIQNFYLIVDTTSIDQISADAEQYAVWGSAAQALWTAITVAISTLEPNPAALHGALQRIDSVSLPSSGTDLGRFGQDLTSAITNAGAPEAQGAQLAPIPPNRSAQSGVQVLVDRIRAMDWLYKATVGFVVFVTAYQAFYVNKWTFGSLSDYLAVLLWALGLTTTGTQIIAKVHKP